jgi:hypothetical protein
VRVKENLMSSRFRPGFRNKNPVRLDLYCAQPGHHCKEQLITIAIFVFSKKSTSRWLESMMARFVFLFIGLTLLGGPKNACGQSIAPVDTASPKIHVVIIGVPMHRH